jgi:hypothetical protein
MSMNKTLLTALMWCLATSAWAHGGEDHDHESGTAPQVQAGQVPRVSAETDDFELVAVLNGAAGVDGSQVPPVLTLYLDRFASNRPVVGATIEVESGAFKAVAKAVADGVYTVPGQAFAQPGRYLLTVSVQSAEGSDLLEATLQNDTSPLLAASTLPTRYTRWAVWLGAAVLLLLVGMALARRRGRVSTSQAELI